MAGSDDAGPIVATIFVLRGSTRGMKET